MEGNVFVDGKPVRQLFPLRTLLESIRIINQISNFPICSSKYWSKLLCEKVCDDKWDARDATVVCRFSLLRDLLRLSLIL